MSNKFIGLDDAATQLGISKERLNELREGGDLRAYRDGSSWKFRTEEIDKLAEAGVPSADGSSADDAGDDFGFGLDSDESDLSLDLSGSALSLGGDELSLDESDDVLEVEPLSEGDDAESILLSDNDLEGGLPRPPSTIIGKTDLGIDDDDLTLKPDSGIASSPKPESKAKPTAEEADLPLDMPLTPDPSKDFDGLEELELDLDAESSRLLDAGDVAAAQAAAAAGAMSEDLSIGVTDEDNEFELDLDESGDSLILDTDSSKSSSDDSPSGSIAGLSGLDMIEIGEDEQDDLVLGEDSDDMSLASGDSGINLAPSDSGIALDEVPLDLAGSSIGSALDLASLSASMQDSLPSPDASDVASGDDFLLMPVSGDDSGDEDSSQIVALDAIEEVDEPVSFEPDASFSPAESEVGLGFEPTDDDELGGDLGGGITPASATAAVAAVPDTTFPTWIIALLVCSLMSMTLCGLMALDLVQSIWAWDEPFDMNSAVMDQILAIMGK